MFKKLVLGTAFIFWLMFVYRRMNIKFSKEIKYPIYEGILGELFIKMGDNQYLTTIENEMVNGDLKKINVLVSSIDISTFHNVEGRNQVIAEYEDKNYSYLIHDGEDKIIIREKK
ncbi:hypothetical protein [Flectobacillus roseus]|uniref:DUF3139 domain-containing protein n=1 Tax=Flectobacillus roseus TaxID=502259 RepID=A0ABT6YFX5_9BACT|nr:hypothetical protein [Flectobacillus roseus]MDI9862501.1 hypothetical protein [Flectobacillus roseus]